MEGGGVGARIANSSAFAICGVNLFQLRAGVTKSHDCLPGLRLSGNLRELQSSLTAAGGSSLTEGRPTSPPLTHGPSSGETEKHGVRVEMNIWTAGCSLCRRTRHPDLLNQPAVLFQLQGTRGGRTIRFSVSEFGHDSCLLHQNQRTRSQSRSQRLQESLRQDADPRWVGELEEDSSDGENSWTVAAKQSKTSGTRTLVLFGQ